MLSHVHAPPRFTVEQFIKIGDLGVFDDRRVELRSGYLIEMPAPSPVHRTIVNRLQSLCVGPFADRRLEIQQPIEISGFDMPLPDLMIVRSPVEWRTIVPDDVQLLIEVAVSHPERDQDEKLPHYLRVGVPEIWIINVPLRQIEIYRPPSIMPARIARAAAGETIAEQPPNMARLDVALLFQGMP